MASPLSRGLISGAAVQGVSFGALTGRGATIRDAQEIGLRVSNRIGCGTSAEVLSCMRAASANALVRAAGPLDLAPPVGGMVLPKSPIELVAYHRTVPLLIGFDREEDAIFSSPFPNPYGYDDWVTDTYALVGPARGTAARTLYPQSAYQSFLWSYVTMRTDAVRGCPTRRLANSVRAPIWRWLYTHTDQHDTRLAQFKASHLLEDQFSPPSPSTSPPLPPPRATALAALPPGAGTHLDARQSDRGQAPLPQQAVRLPGHAA